jgi:hypothetical protein
MGGGRGKGPFVRQCVRSFGVCLLQHKYFYIFAIGNSENALNPLWVPQEFLFFNFRCKIFNMGPDPNLHTEWRKETVNYEFHGIVGSFTSNVDFIEKHFYKRGLSSLRMMEQKTGLTPMSFKMRKKHFLIKAYNEIILSLQAAGITDFLINRDKRKGDKIDDYGPQILDFEHLDVCFLVCMVPLVLAFVVFIVEILWHRLQKKLSECFKKEETLIPVTKFPKIIQVQPRIQRRFSVCSAHESDLPKLIEDQRKLSV